MRVRTVAILPLNSCTLVTLGTRAPAGAQALAAAGKSVTYIMAYGRWRCVQSVMRYVRAPDFVRLRDAVDMVSASTEDTLAGIQTALADLLATRMRPGMHATASMMTRAASALTGAGSDASGGGGGGGH